MQTLQEKRRRFLRKRCRIVTINETLYHGSPVEGLAAIRACGKIFPQGHGELTMDTFCVSPNDNMLKCFGDDDGTTGMVFDPTPLRCLHLDWFHHNIISEAQLDLDRGTWTSREKDEEIAQRLGYWNTREHRMEIRPDDFLELIPDIDGLIFPWQKFERFHNPFLPNEVKLYWPDWNTEAEVSLLEPGCKKIWKALDQIVIRDKWFDKQTGWRRVRKENSRALQRAA